MKRSTEDQEGWHRVFAIDRHGCYGDHDRIDAREVSADEYRKQGRGRNTVSDDGSTLSVLEIAFGDCAANFYAD